ncbi:hypothetical protein [Amycolatopsis sp. lyj-112]|uniref:hypothetical protein n=1 Tax=Amycolatopsis sp. lyj-112 TaxID=2789288 RepID=UPI003978E149
MQDGGHGYQRVPLPDAALRGGPDEGDRGDSVDVDELSPGVGEQLPGSEQPGHCAVAGGWPAACQRSFTRYVRPDLAAVRQATETLAGFR